MPFVSYAQNAEDVLLWRALNDQGPGFYVDVGAAHPDDDSVTRAFYERGWHGLNIEAVPLLARRIELSRPRDTTLAVAAGAAEGTAELHVVDGTGLSTIDAPTAATLGPAGFPVHRLHVPVRTLSALLREHAPEDIDFLKIDVEGAERAVLEGLDLRLHRPRIVLVEAVQPLTHAPTHAAWETLLLAGLYRFAIFDGLNRFYVAEEWADRLLPRLAVPANVTDDYVRAADASWARQAAEQTATLDRALATMEAAQDGARAAYARAFEQARDLGSLRHRLSQLEQALAAERGARSAAEAEAATATARVTVAAAEHQARLHAELAAATRWLDATRSSTSWRVTAPLRATAALFRRSGDDLPAVHESPPVSPAPQAAPAAPTQPTPPAASPLPGPQATQQPLRAVHQFHSGSATGDAVTNSMLLIRQHLRAAGYRSEIFVEHRDPALADTLHLLEDLPAYADHVLLVHHSMGHGALPRILAHPAPKLLYYHNITPTALLPDEPSLRRFADLGRAQLGTLRPAVRAALAASEYNAIELRRAGFDTVRACTLLFDLDALRARAAHPAPRAPGHPFTVLFVGRIIESKAQADLIDAFALFRTRYRAATGQPARLVLVGRTDSPGDYLAALDARMRANRLEAELVVTGAVPDAELHAQYSAADLYVSLSHHEGFGVPLAEAVAYGIPVLACPAGAIPYTLGGRRGLLASRTPADVAARMLDVALDEPTRTALRDEQQQALRRFALETQWPILHEALALAGAAPAPDPAARAALAPHLAFAVTGHASGSYSLAAVNRGLAAAIEAECPGRVRLVPVEGVRTTDLSNLDPASRNLASRPPPTTSPEAVISQHYPIHVPDEPGDVNLAFVFWEESLLPAPTIETLATSFDGVLAPTAFVAKALRDSGLPLPICVIGQAPDLRPFMALRPPPPDAAPSRPFTFLHVSSCFPRKGVDVLLAAYAGAFRATDPVRLVIKGFPNPHNTVVADLAALRAGDPGAPAIELIDRDLDPDALLDLYRHADAMVLPTRGEGFNLPAAEAMAASLPLIVTGYGGHMDFCTPDTARLLSYRLAPSRSHLATPHSLWAEPDQDDLVAALRDAVAARRDPDAAVRLSAQLRRARAAVSRRLDGAAMVRRIEDFSLDLLLRPAPAPIRIAWLTSWGVRCGIAEYSRQLLDAMPPHPAVAAHAVLSDARTPPEAAAGRRPAWHVGAELDLHRLSGAIMAEDPAVVVIQHQPGLVDWPGLAAWLESPALRERIVVVTLHTTLALERQADGVRAATCAALAGVARVMVHTPADMDRLARLGVAANVALMPHGVRAPLAPAPRPAGDPPVIGCYGFFLPDKGIPELIEAVALLRRRWPSIRLRLINAEHEIWTSAEEIARCRALAQQRGLADAIDWETRFLPDDDSLARLAGCDIVVLPTQSSLESSSASVRTALAAGRPVLVTPLPLFDDVGDAVLRSQDLTPASIAAALESFIEDPSAREMAERRSRRWLSANSWPAIAARFQQLLVGLSRITKP